MSKKNKPRSDPWFGKIVLLIVICVAAWYVVTLIVPDEPIIHRTVDPSTTIPITTTESENQEAILLGSIERMRSANVFLVVHYAETAKIGSGAIIAADEEFYLAITNAHVVTAPGAVNKQVMTNDGVTSEFEILDVDHDLDLALIRFPKEGRSDIIPLKSSGDIQIDDLVLAIGNPLGEVGTVSIGSVTGFGIYDEIGIIHEVIIHSATIGFGSSGGALVTIHGDLVGINTWSDDGEYYAIPIEAIQGFIDSQNI